jgi:hypothetical protein
LFKDVQGVNTRGDALQDKKNKRTNLSLSKVDYGEDWGEDDEDDKEPSAPDKEDPGSLALFKDVQGVNTRGDALQDKKNKRTNLSLSKVDYGEDWGEDDEDDKEPSAPDKEDPGSLALFKDVQGVNTRGNALQDKKDKRANLSLSKVDYGEDWGEDDEDDKEPSAPDKEDPGSLALFKDVQGVNTRGNALQDKKNKRVNLSLSKVDYFCPPGHYCPPPPKEDPGSLALFKSVQDVKKARHDGPSLAGV